MKKVAIIGAGVYGLMIANELKGEFEVTVFEKEQYAFTGASMVNQSRIHRGYHYPRSVSTSVKCKILYDEFIKRFPESVVKINNHYCIAGGMSPSAYESFMTDLDLPFKKITSERFTDKVQAVYEVEEDILDFRILRNKLLEGINVIYEADVFGIKEDKNGRVHIAVGDQIKEFDHVINCTYSDINNLSLWNPRKVYQYELVEIPLINMPDKFSFAIMDGNFFGLIPFGNSNLIMMYDVSISVLERSIGIFPDFNKEEMIKKYKTTEKERFETYRTKAKEYYPDIQYAEYVKSLYTVRAVIPYMDHTDERPYEIIKDGNLISVFSSKISFSMQAARKVREMLI